MASALINVPAKARRGDIIEIKTLMSHIMETGYRHTGVRRSRSARHHHELYVPLQRERDFPRRPVSGDLRQSLHHLLHHRDRERQVRVRMDRRPGVFRNRVGFDHGRMRFAERHSRCAADRGPCFRRRNPASRTSLRLRLHEAGHQGDAGRGYRQSRHALGARRRRLMEAQGWAPPTRPAPIATAMPAPA